MAADATGVIDAVLSDAMSEIQSLINRASEGCSGGAHGRPPVSWGAIQPHGDAAVKQIADLRVALASGSIKDGAQKIDAIAAELNTFINMMAGNCSGGSHGQDPVHYASYRETRTKVIAELEVVKRFLPN